MNDPDKDLTTIVDRKCSCEKQSTRIWSYWWRQQQPLRSGFRVINQSFYYSWYMYIEYQLLSRCLTIWQPQWPEVTDSSPGHTSAQGLDKTQWDIKAKHSVCQAWGIEFLGLTPTLTLIQSNQPRFEFHPPKKHLQHNNLILCWRKTKEYNSKLKAKYLAETLLILSKLKESIPLMQD